MELKYALQSKENGKYLSHLFADNHNDMFKESLPFKGKTYFYDNKDIAESIAHQINARVLNFIAESVGF